MKQIETTIQISAPAAKVWHVLTDFERHPEWNPFITGIFGDKSVCGTLHINIHPPGGKGMSFAPKILAFTPGRELRWKGKLLLPGIFDGEHYFLLEAVSEQETRFIHGEKFSGILVALFGGMLEKTKEGFEAMNAALKKECERG